jgi:hypothetical protein
MARRLRTRLAALPPTLAIVLASAGLGGCNWESGTGFSLDRYIYRSTSWRPQTVTVVDTRTGERIWALDVPVGQQAVVGFYKNRHQATNPTMPDELYWGLMPADEMIKGQDSRMPCPPASARRVDVTLRATTEMPGAILSNQGPVDTEEVLEVEGQQPAAQPR